jgi:hypothetical protein
MKKLKGAELKLPPFLRDLYQDLRDRRLLPLVVLLFVAIVAVPILLADPAPKEAAPPVPSPRASQSNAKPAAMAVVRAAPGLRQPSKRLEHRQPTDPFKQQYVSPALSEKSVTVEGGATETGGEEVVSGDGPGAPDGGAPVAAGQPDLIFFATTVTVKIVRSETDADGQVVHQEPVVRSRVLPTTTLLGEKAQVVTYMGPSPKTRNPTFLISDQVTAIFGEGKCLAGTERCQVVELELNEPEVFVYGANDVRYRISVLDTQIVETGRVNRP